MIVNMNLISIIKYFTMPLVNHLQRNKRHSFRSPKANAPSHTLRESRTTKNNKIGN